MSRRRYRLRTLLASAGMAGLALTAGCTTKEVLNQGYIVDDQTIQLVPVGSSREQVLTALGTPSTKATFDNEVFYYISQKRERPVAFMNPHIVDQRVLAIYFGPGDTVTQIANYGLQNGRIFDFISRTTPTGGRDVSFLGQILQPGGAPAGLSTGGAQAGADINRPAGG